MRRCNWFCHKISFVVVLDWIQVLVVFCLLYCINYVTLYDLYLYFSCVGLCAVIKLKEISCERMHYHHYYYYYYHYYHYYVCVCVRSFNRSGCLNLQCVPQHFLCGYFVRPCLRSIGGESGGGSGEGGICMFIKPCAAKSKVQHCTNGHWHWQTTVFVLKIKTNDKTHVGDQTSNWRKAFHSYFLTEW